MPWDLQVSTAAARTLRRLPPRDREAITRALDGLATDLGATDIRKLAGQANSWRLRVGDWRVLFDLANAAGVILVTDVRPRGRAYH